MNAVSDKKVCSRASREARMVNRIVEGIIDHPAWLEGLYICYATLIVCQQTAGHGDMHLHLGYGYPGPRYFALDHAFELSELRCPLNHPDNCLYGLSRRRKDFHNPVSSSPATKRLPRRSPQE